MGRSSVKIAFRKWTRAFRELVQFLPTRPHNEWRALERIQEGRPTVVLISGFGATNRALSVIRKRLMRDGFNVVIIAMDWKTLSDGVEGLYRMAERLAGVCLALRKKPGTAESRVYLVAHSAGGLVARYYLQLLGGVYYCDGLVTLATPHRGTWWAVLGFVCHLILKARILLQMLPISPFIRKLNEASLPENFPFISIYSTADTLCPPFTTRLPEGLSGKPHTRVIELPGLSHGDFLLSKVSYEVLVHELRAQLPENQLESTSVPAS